MSGDISNNYDVVIIGCGIAGSLVGALLSNKERKKVLILEASAQIGGRAIILPRGRHHGCRRVP